MPTYTCSTARGFLSDVQKARLAEAITCAHCEITGAPQHFAQVIFNPIDNGDHFMGGRALAHDHIFICGRIRAGRSAVPRKELIERIVKDVGGITEYEPFSVWVYLLELPAAVMAEFGMVIPEPGDETCWTAVLPPALRHRMEKIGAQS